MIIEENILLTQSVSSILSYWMLHIRYVL